MYWCRQQGLSCRWWIGRSDARLVAKYGFKSYLYKLIQVLKNRSKILGGRPSNTAKYWFFQFLYKSFIQIFGHVKVSSLICVCLVVVLVVMGEGGRRRVPGC